jgi:hypothetical protein
VYLRLGSQNLGDEGVKILANAPTLANLHTLDLTSNDLSDTAATYLEAAPHLQPRELILLGNRSTLSKPMRDRLKKRFGKGVCSF